YIYRYLWPIFHYMPLSEHQDKVLENMAWKAYEEVNLLFAQKIVEVYKPGDLIWIQDYHLLLVPRMLRKMLPKSYIGLFLHSPFPSSEFFRCLPRREEILDGMLGADLLCFQTYSYGRHFVSACIRVMGYESVGGGIEANGRLTSITHCPIGIDADRIESDRRRMPGVKPKMEALKKLYEGKKIIVGRDKLDPTKGVLPKLRAFEELLKRFPQWRNQVALIQVTSPSPTDSPSLATKISELVDHINATYGTLHFQPVHHYHQTIERDEYFALLSVADLAVITSVRDGMNTTSMEYTICQKEFKNPLILSEFTGVTGSMKAAIKVNPWDLGGVAKAIDQCLNMSEAEKKQRHAQLYSRVISHSSAVWASTLLLQLLDCLRSDQAMQYVKLLDEVHLMKKYNEAEKRLLLFDYDGTLTPIVKNPKDAIPPPGLIEALNKLCSDSKNIVYIISGRDGAFLQEHLGEIKGLGMSAEHGCYLREPGSEEWIDLTVDFEMGWMNDVEEIFKYYEARTLGAFVETKTSSVTWHYRNADPEFGLFQAKECQALLESLQERMPIDILKGKKNIECRPAHTNKGEIVKRLLYSTPEIGFALCAGDDKTDEDMFRALKQ
ncbi:family 20 glycosyltransferase, partial [Melampsora larici-populina 98AG31]